MRSNPDFSLADKFAGCIDFSNPNNAFVKARVIVDSSSSFASATETIHAFYSGVSGTFNGLIKALRVKNINLSATYFLQLRQNSASGALIDIITLPPNKELYLDTYWAESVVDQVVWWGVSTSELTVNLAPMTDISITWRYVPNS